MTIRKRNDETGFKRGERGRYIEPSGVRPGSGFDYGPAGTNPKGCGKYTTDDSRANKQAAQLRDWRQLMTSTTMSGRNSLDDDAGGSRARPNQVWGRLECRRAAAKTQPELSSQTSSSAASSSAMAVRLESGVTEQEVDYLKACHPSTCPESLSRWTSCKHRSCMCAVALEVASKKS